LSNNLLGRNDRNAYVGEALNLGLIAPSLSFSMQL
jgi:hypothetical protein